MNCWRGIYFGELPDFSVGANIEFVINLVTEMGYVDIISHVVQASNGDVAVRHANETTRWHPACHLLCIPCIARRLNMRIIL